MTDRFDEGKSALAEVLPRSDLWSDVERRAAEGAATLAELPAGAASRRSVRWLVASAAAVAAVIGAVLVVDGGRDERILTTPPPSGPSADTLAGTTWKLVRITGFGAEPIEPEDRDAPIFSFTRNEVTWTECGQLTATYELRGGVLSLGDAGSGAGPECDPARLQMAINRVMLADRIQVELGAEAMTLTAEPITLTLHSVESGNNPADQSYEDYVFHPYGAIWPETAASQAPGVISGPSLNHLQWRSSGTATAVEFARQVLGWTDARIVEGQSEPSEDGRSGEVHQLESPSLNARVDVRVGRTVYGRWHSVYGVDFAAPDPSASVQVIGRQVFASHSPWPDLATSATARFDYGGRVAEGPVEQQFNLGFDPDTTGSVLVLFHDESGRVIGAWGTPLRAGDFAAG